MTDSVYDENVFLRGRVDTLEKVVAALQAQCQKSESLATTVSQLRDEVNSKNQALEASLAHSRSQASELKATTELVEQLAATVKGLQAHLDTHADSSHIGDVDIEQTDGITKRKRIEADSHELALRTDTDLLEQYETKIESLENGLACQTEEINKVRDWVEELQGQTDSLEGDYERSARRTDASLDELEKASLLRKEVNEQLQRQLEALEKAVAGKTRSIDELEVQVNTLQLQVSGNKSSQGWEMRRLGRDIESLEKTAKDLKERLNEMPSSAKH